MVVGSSSLRPRPSSARNDLSGVRDTHTYDIAVEFNGNSHGSKCATSPEDYIISSCFEASKRFPALGNVFQQHRNSITRHAASQRFANAGKRSLQCSHRPSTLMDPTESYLLKQQIKRKSLEPPLVPFRSGTASKAEELIHDRGPALFNDHYECSRRAHRLQVQCNEDRITEVLNAVKQAREATALRNSSTHSRTPPKQDSSSIEEAPPLVEDPHDRAKRNIAKLRERYKEKRACFQRACENRYYSSFDEIMANRDHRASEKSEGLMDMFLDAFKDSSKNHQARGRH